MAKRTYSIIRQRADRLRSTIIWLILLLGLTQIAAFVGLMAIVWGEAFEFWLPELLIAMATLIVAGLITLRLVRGYTHRTELITTSIIERELQPLRLVKSQNEALQVMASALGASVSLERVMEIALDACAMATIELEMAPGAQVGAAYVFENGKLVLAAERDFLSRDYEHALYGREGVIGLAFEKAEPAVTHRPDEDVELKPFDTFNTCQTVVCVPLRAGYHIHGAIILGLENEIDLRAGELALFSAVADLAVVSIQKAELFLDLKAEKAKVLAAEEEERQALTSVMHDGLAQRTAAIAMRISLIRSLMVRSPEQAVTELKKVEGSARQASQDIRNLLFTLRPMTLENRRLATAIDHAIQEIAEQGGPNIQLNGYEHAGLLDDEAQQVTFYIIREALDNVQKHAQAKVAEINFWRENGHIFAQVRDNGVGFDAQNGDRPRGALGLVYMYKRAARVDGTLEVVSQPGQGTSVTLRVPLDKHSRDQYVNI